MNATRILAENVSSELFWDLEALSRSPPPARECGNDTSKFIVLFIVIAALITLNAILCFCERPAARSRGARIIV